MKKLLLILLLLCILLTRAEVDAALTGLSGTAQEVEVFTLLQESKFVKAREIAESLLRANSNSFVGNYAMGVVIRRGESNLPKAYFYLQRAKSSYERLHGKTGSDNKTWRWHLNILWELINTAGEMDQYEKQLEYLRAYDEAYIPKQTAYYAWPLMKLGRIKEARQKIYLALKESKLEDDKITALNTLASIEAELDNREESYNAFKNVNRMAKGKKRNVAVKRNMGSAALILLKFDEAEKEFINATTEGGGPYETSNPWSDLVYIYTAEARFDEAFGAVREMISWGLAREPYLDQQCISSEDSNKALFLLACGYTEQAHLITRRLVDRPDRLGYTSEKKYRFLGGMYFLHYCALTDYMQLLKERLTWADRKEKVKILCSLLALRFEKALLKARLKCITMGNDALRPTLIPYHFAGIGSPEFWEPDLINIIGKGLFKAEINRIRKDYKYRKLSEPYLLEFEGELAYQWHNNGEAKRCFREAKEKLPAAEKLLIARINAFEGRIAEGEGDFPAALSSYQSAYRTYPAVFRHLAMRLPVQIRIEGDDPSLAGIRKHIRKSPRFRIRDMGFTIDIRILGNRIWGSLLDQMGNNVFSASSVRTGDAEKDTRLFLEEFHLKAFSAPISASATDINSLDGSNLEGDRMRSDIKDFFFEKKEKEEKK